MKRQRITKRLKEVIEIILEAGYTEIIELCNEEAYRVSVEEVNTALEYLYDKLNLQ